jgi:hypothetical protein
MTLASSDLTLTAVPVIQTPDLNAAVARYLAEFGFEVQQAVQGVLAVLRLDSLRLLMNMVQWVPACRVK